SPCWHRAHRRASLSWIQAAPGLDGVPRPQHGNHADVDRSCQGDRPLSRCSLQAPPSKLEVIAFGLPGREAVDVDVVLVQAANIAVSGELDLEFDLAVLHGLTTNRAVIPGTWPAPHAIWAAVG